MATLFGNPHLLLVITTFLWGANTIAGKLAVGHVSPMMLTVGRWAIAIVFIWWLARHEVRRDWPVIRRHLPYLMLMGMTGYTLFNVPLYSAAHFTSAINMAIEQAAIPLVIFIGNFLVFRIRTTSRQWIGFGITVIGVVLTVTNGNPMKLSESGLNIGDLMMLFAVFVYAAYSIGLKAKPDIHWKSFFAVMVTSAFITSIPFALWEATTDHVIYPVTLQGVLVVLYAALFPSIVSQIFYILAVEKLGANIAGLYINLIPIFGTLMAVAFLGEPFGWHHAVALPLVIGGIIYAQTGKSMR
ncbi:MAG: DMT family transporter [Rhizobiaceae bacterium]|nr:DMT family transporter [Rhizobiaceae bacterium]